MRRDARVIVLRAADRSVVTTVSEPIRGPEIMRFCRAVSRGLACDRWRRLCSTYRIIRPACRSRKAALPTGSAHEPNKREELMTVTNFFTPMPSAIGADVIAVNDRPSSTETSAATPSSDGSNLGRKRNIDC